MSAEEVRDVLLCFLFVLKYLDDDRLVEWWKTHSQAQQQSFFNVLEWVVKNYSNQVVILFIIYLLNKLSLFYIWEQMIKLNHLTYK